MYLQTESEVYRSS